MDAGADNRLLVDVLTFLGKNWGPPPHATVLNVPEQKVFVKVVQLVIIVL